MQIDHKTSRGVIKHPLLFKWFLPLWLKEKAFWLYIEIYLQAASSWEEGPYVTYVCINYMPELEQIHPIYL